MLKEKNILLGVTGSIAAYKAAILVRLLVKNGASVKIIMTPLAKEFITPLTLATLSKNPILVDFFNPENGDWNSHVDLGLWADAYLIAPATANTMAKMAHGIADNLLLTSYLSARCPVFVAPAMDLDMFSHKTTQQNIETLKDHGVAVIEAQTGELASGLEGKGRMEEPEKIFSFLEEYFNHSQNSKLAKKKVLITAGPTIEYIDPVRYITNHSSGKMGYALAEVLADGGADVTIVSGPTTQVLNHPNVNVVNVRTTEEMFKACLKIFPDSDVAILAAAVSDFQPVNYANQKLKNKENEFSINLKPTTDIAKELGVLKKENQTIVGFALETENEKDNARKKLESKKFDMIVLNSLNDKGAGFGYDTNKITIIDKNNNIDNFELKDKKLVAIDIVKKLAQII